MWLNIILVVVAIAILVFVYLYAQPSKSREQFALNVEQDYRQTIVTSFNTVLGRDPLEFEVQMYRDYMSSPYDNTSVTSRLEKSTEYKQIVENFATSAVAPMPTMDVSTADQTVKSMDLAKRLEVYRSVLSIYEKNLGRLPSMVELNYYTAKLVTDKTFNLDKITLILQASKEYSILQKNQTNTVNAELEGSITDAQLTLMVNDIYSSMFKGEKPSKIFEDFIKAKFVEYKLNEPKFRKMSTMLNEIDKESTFPATAVTPTAAMTPSTTTAAAAPTTTTVAVAAAPTTAAAPTATQATSQDVVRQASTPTATQVAAPTQATPQAPPPTVVAATPATPATQATPTTQAAQSNAVAPKCNCATNNNKTTNSTLACYNKNKVFDSLYANIQNAEAFMCKNVTSTNSSTYGDRNKYAELQDARNKSELKFECSRNQFAPYDYDPNIVPNLRNTKFGTFLDDANNTRVGSIMPQFIFKEYI